MLFPSRNEVFCPTCGARIETTASGQLGCLACLLRAALEESPSGSEETPDDIPDSLGSYLIERREDGTPWTLGQGTMGVTYRARDVSLQREVALKLIGTKFSRLMFRLAYRNFGGCESLLGNSTVSSGGVAGVRWFELRNVIAGPPVVYQESTYHPDTTWRWMGSIAMDQSGDIALGYSASSPAINPEVRYTGRLASDPINTLPQGEATLYAGGGSQIGTSNHWGEYSDLTIDPVDDCTFWYTQNTTT